MKQILNPLGPLAENLDPTRGNGISKFCRDNEKTTIVSMVSHQSVGALIDVTLGLKLGNELPREEDMKTISDLGFQWAGVRAILSWGTGNASFNAVCDWLHGTRISLGAENVRVGAKYVSRVSSDVDPNDDSLWWPEYNLDVGLTYGGKGHNSNPARLTELLQIDPGDSCDVWVPPFAISLTAQPLTSAPSSVEIQVQTIGSGFQTTYLVSAPLTNAGQYNVENALPLPNGAPVRVRVTNIGLAPMSLFLIFGLAL